MFLFFPSLLCVDQQTIRSIIGLTTLFAALTASTFAQLNVTVLGSAGEPVTLMSESFVGDTLDVSKWSVNLPYGDSNVVAGNAVCTSYNRGYVKSVKTFTGDLEINYMVKLTGNRTAADFYWKTTGEIKGPDRSCVGTNGLAVMLSHEKQELYISVRRDWYNVGADLSTYVNLPLETWISVRIVDQNNTVKAVKKLIDNVLKAAGSDKTASDLFDISLGYGVTDNETYDTKFVTEAEFEKIKEAYQEWEDDDQSGDEPRYDPRYTEDGFSNIIVTVKPDIPTEAKAAAKAAAKTLSDLTGLFQIDATYG